MTTKMMSCTALVVVVFSNLVFLPVYSNAAQGGAGTFESPAWVDFTFSNGERYQSVRGQTTSNQVTPNAAGFVTVSLSKQIEFYFDTIWQGGAAPVLVDKNFNGSRTELFQSSLVVNTPAGLINVMDRLVYTHGAVLAFLRPNGVSDEFKWQYKGIESTKMNNPAGTDGSLTVSAYIDHRYELAPGIPDVPRESVDFAFNYNLNNNGSWDYDYRRDVLEVGASGGLGLHNTHLFENGDFVQMPGFLGTGIMHGNGIKDVVTDYNARGLGIDWIYEATDAWDFLNGIASHPSLFAYGFNSWTREYIFKDFIYLEA